MRAASLVIPAAFVSDVGAQTAYKCVDDNGRTTLQQAPSTNGQRLNVTTSSFGDPPHPPARPKSRLSRFRNSVETPLLPELGTATPSSE